MINENNILYTKMIRIDQHGTDINCKKIINRPTCRVHHSRKLPSL